ncbi:unnamed protein product [Phytophthora lilii]|uniref:Unnamed protein product n=1 Tax=Phytophthora lilii TaxID=2077276 RepID=A0A9W6U9U4_9STRA|nr:unnamed protein product [Phytophthora lilii]
MAIRTFTGLADGDTLAPSITATPEEPGLPEAFARQYANADARAIQLLRINMDDEATGSPNSKTVIASSTTTRHYVVDDKLFNNSDFSPKIVADNTTEVNEGIKGMKITHGRDIHERKLKSQTDSVPAMSLNSSFQPNTDVFVGSSNVPWADTPQAEAELHARSVTLLPIGDTRKRALRCIGWRNTGNCSVNGPREPHKDLTCSDFVPNNASGYCEVEDTKSGERFRVMRRACSILRNRVPFRCINAPAFARFRVQAHSAVTTSRLANFTLLNGAVSAPQHRNGIVMVVYPKLIPSAYATIRTLREILGCVLPIEIWFRPDEMESFPNALIPLKRLAQNTSISQISFNQITDPVAKRFVAKVYAIYHSSFERVLFLDADNVPVRDPSFLFDSPEFKRTGAIFWPDFWHPTSTMFGLHNKSLLWELLDMPFVDMFEQESGQLVVDRRRHAAPLELVLFYAVHEPNFLVHYKLAWGDKDLFRLAWLKLNATFYMIETPPAMAGMVTNSSAFCGMTMVQHDPEGDVLFLHRNKRKLAGTATPTFFAEEGTESSDEADSTASDFDPLDQNLKSDDYPDPSIWTHVLSFDNSWSRSHYVVQAFATSLDFTTKQKCFGRRSLLYSPQFRVHKFANLGFSDFETKLRQFAKEATML